MPHVEYQVYNYVKKCPTKFYNCNYSKKQQQRRRLYNLYIYQLYIRYIPGTNCSAMSAMPVPDAARVGHRELPWYLAEPLARRTALLYGSVFLVGLLSTCVHFATNSAYFAKAYSEAEASTSTPVGTASTADLVQRLVIYICMATFDVLMAAWYPTSIEVFYGSAAMLLMDSCCLTCSFFWCYEEVTSFEVHMPNVACVWIHRTAAAFLLLSNSICYVCSIRGACTWRVVRTARACESIVLGSGVLALRYSGPPAVYPPGVSFAASLISQATFSQLPALLLTRANRLRLAEWYAQSGLYHVSVRLRDIQDPAWHEHTPVQWLPPLLRDAHSFCRVVDTRSTVECSRAPGDQERAPEH